MATEGQDFIDGLPGLEREATADDIETIVAAPEALEDVARRLKGAGFSVLLDAVPIDMYPREPRFEITYLLLRPEGAAPAHLRLKVRLPGGSPRVVTLSRVWPAAGWAEREAYDFFGIEFEEHPDPRRLLMPDDWEGFPMRKDYPVQIKEPVKTDHPVQLTAEEFAANIEAARSRAQG